MTLLTNIPRLITAFDVAIVYIDQFQSLMNRVNERSVLTAEFRTKASSAKQVLHLMTDGDNITPVALDQLAVTSIMKAYTTMDGWLTDDKKDYDQLEQLKSITNKRLKIVLAVFRNRLAELILMNEEKDLTFCLSEHKTDEDARQLKMLEFDKRLEKTTYIRIPLVGEHVDYWWQLTKFEWAGDSVILSLNRRAYEENENIFTSHRLEFKDFDRVLLSERDPIKTEIDQAVAQGTQERCLRESKWVWLPDQKGSESGKWWTYKADLDEIGAGFHNTRLLERVIDKDTKKVREFNSKTTDLSGACFATSPSPEDLSDLLSTVKNAKYVQPYGEGEWLYVDNVKVTKMVSAPNLNTRMKIHIDTVSVNGERAQWVITDVELYYSNTLHWQSAPESLVLAESEKLRDFLDKAGSNKYMTVTQLVKDRPVSVTYVIEGVELYPDEVKDSTLKLSFLDSIADNGFIRKRADSIVFDRTSTYSFSNERPTV